jgi:hypothetical protein
MQTEPSSIVRTRGSRALGELSMVNAAPRALADNPAMIRSPGESGDFPQTRKDTSRELTGESTADTTFRPSRNQESIGTCADIEANRADSSTGPSLMRMLQ